MSSPEPRVTGRTKSTGGRTKIVVAVAAVVGGIFMLARASETPPAIEAVRVFPNVDISLPVILTNAGDRTNRIFVGSQHGVIYILPHDQNASETTKFLDIEERVVCNGEEGLLGLAFHPRYRQNGQFFVYYTTTETPHMSVISRFRVSSDNASKADETSEEEIMRIKQPHGTHNGGTLAFGPDGYLYVGLGDGGNAKEPRTNGQDLKTLLGSILRIDIDRKEDGKNYAIPKDNPFVKNDDARPEIWAYGLRNVWRMSFDRETGTLWAGDVGQDTWEEINIIVRGGNYGWSLREAKHPFGPEGTAPRTDLIEPIWEYNHIVGKSVTGGNVYRGRKIPALRGTYVFADYLANKAWALRYDEETGRVVNVREIEGVENMPIFTFGEDEEGEVYFADSFGQIFGLKELEKR